MTTDELAADDWRRAVYGRSRISGIGTRRRPHQADRERVIERQGYACLYCEIPISTVIRRRGRELILRANWDHFVPYSYSQRNPSANWVLACHVCNNIKTSRMFADVEAARRVILPERIAKGYESPEEVFYRSGLERQNGLVVVQAPRPTDKQLEALQAYSETRGSTAMGRSLGICAASAQKRLLGATRRLGASSPAEAVQIAQANGYLVGTDAPGQVREEAS